MLFCYRARLNSFTSFVISTNSARKFCSNFFKSLRRQGRGALVATAVAKLSYRRSLFVSFSLAPLVSREKDKDCLGRLLNTYILISLFICSTDIFDIPFPAFFFDTSGAKKKAHKKETPSRDALRALP